MSSGPIVGSSRLLCEQRGRASMRCLNSALRRHRRPHLHHADSEHVLRINRPGRLGVGNRVRIVPGAVSHHRGHVRRFAVTGNRLAHGDRAAIPAGGPLWCGHCLSVTLPVYPTCLRCDQPVIFHTGSGAPARRYWAQSKADQRSRKSAQSTFPQHSSHDRCRPG